MEQAIELWRLFRRRFWLIAIISTIGVVGAAVYAKTQPAIYEAQSKILVKGQQIPDALARSTVTESANERLQLIKQRLLSRSNLSNIIEELKLFLHQEDITISEQIGQLRAATRFVPIGSSQRSRQNSGITAFKIIVSYSDPAKTARIANRFATIVLEQNLQSRATRASDTLKYFTIEAERVSAELRALEKEMSAFKDANRDSLPESRAFLQTELAQLNDTILDLDRRRLSLAEESGTLLLALEIEPPITTSTPEENQLRQLETQLAQKSAILSDQHREIRSLKAQIESLRAAVVANRQEQENSFQKSKIRHQVKLLQDQIDLMEKQRMEQEERRVKLDEALQRIPSIEIRLNALNRIYKERQSMLAEINQKRAEAETGERLEITQQAESFELIEEAIVPEAPISPDRKKLVVMGGGGSILLALGLAFLLEMFRPRIRSAAQLESQLGLRPVIALPYIRTRRERRNRIIKYVFILLIAVLNISIVIYLIDQNYMPLEPTFDAISENIPIDDFTNWMETWLWPIFETSADG